MRQMEEENEEEGTRKGEEKKKISDPRRSRNKRFEQKKKLKERRGKDWSFLVRSHNTSRAGTLVLRYLERKRGEKKKKKNHTGEGYKLQKLQ